MSTIEPCTESIVVPPYIGKRILEIMAEKGKAFTQQALALRIDMNKDTLGKKLRGKRDLYMFELRRIAEALHMSMERLLKTDTVDDEKQLQQLLDKFEDLDLALEIAQKLSLIAVGATEKSTALNELGRAYYLLQRYEEAHATWLASYEESKKLVDKYGEKGQFHQVLSNLLVSFTVRKDYSDACSILKEMETAYYKDPAKLGATYYTKAKMEEHVGNIQKAREYAKQSLQYYEGTGNAQWIGRAKVTLAHFEYLIFAYDKSIAQLEQATKLLEPYKPLWITAVKEYAKSLIKSNDLKTAKDIIISAISSVDTTNDKNSIVMGKLRILLSICTNDRTEAEFVLRNSQMNNKVRFLAYRYLAKCCIENSDDGSLMKYAIIGEQLDINKNDVLDEEEF